MTLARAGEEDNASATATNLSQHPAPDLGGDLPCARCRYNLRGLSISGVCPECALPIRASLLARLDPMAGELRPLFRPRLTAIGMLVWSGAAFAAALVAWSLRVGDAMSLSRQMKPIASLVPVLVGLSTVGGLAFLKPHAGEQARRGSYYTVVATLLGVALVWLLWRVHVVCEPAGVAAYGDSFARNPVRAFAHMWVGPIIAAVVLLLRPNARLLAARSLLLRSGRADRQTMLSLAVVALVPSVGDALRLAGWRIEGGVGQLMDQIGQGVILVGSLLLTIGLFGVLFDCCRLYGVLVEPPLTLRQMLDAPTDADASHETTP